MEFISIQPAPADLAEAVLDGDSQLAYVPIAWLGFMNHPQAELITQGKSPVTEVWLTTQTIPGVNWFEQYDHCNQTPTKGSCHCGYRDCRRLGIVNMEQQQTLDWATREADLRRAWFVTLEARRAKSREYNLRRKEAAA